MRIRSDGGIHQAFRGGLLVMTVGSVRVPPLLQVLKDPAKRQMIDEYLSGRAMGRRPFGTGESFIDRFAGKRCGGPSPRRPVGIHPPSPPVLWLGRHPAQVSQPEADTTTVHALPGDRAVTTGHDDHHRAGLHGEPLPLDLLLTLLSPPCLTDRGRVCVLPVGVPVPGSEG